MKIICLLCGGTITPGKGKIVFKVCADCPKEGLDEEVIIVNQDKNWPR